MVLHCILYYLLYIIRTGEGCGFFFREGALQSKIYYYNIKIFIIILFHRSLKNINVNLKTTQFTFIIRTDSVILQ